MKNFLHTKFVPLFLLAGAMTLFSCSKSEGLGELSQDSEGDVPSVKTVQYSLAASQVSSSTKMVINGSYEYLFEDGDKLYIENTDSGKEGDVYGFLTIESGAGSSSARFSGTLYLKNEFVPTASTPLKVTLVSPNNRIHTISNDGKRITATVYPTLTDAFAPTLSDAISMYSNITATGTPTWGGTSISLEQNTAFIDMSIAFNVANISLGDQVSVSVRPNDNASDIREGSVTVVKPGIYKRINAVAAYPGGTVLNVNSTIVLTWGASSEYSSTIILNEGPSSPKTLAANKYYSVGRILTEYTIATP